MKRLLLHNLALKVSAVALAVMLWLLVVSKGQTEISLSVPIEYANVPQGLEIARYGEKTATVVIRIHESMGKNLREENPPQRRLHPRSLGDLRGLPRRGPRTFRE